LLEGGTRLLLAARRINRLEEERKNRAGWSNKEMASWDNKQRLVEPVMLER